MWLCLPIPKNNPLWYFGQSRCYPADFRQIHVFPEQSDDFLVSFSKLVEFKQREGSKVRKGGADTALGDGDTGRRAVLEFWSFGVLQCWREETFQNFLLIFPSPPHFEEGTCHVWRRGKWVWYICLCRAGKCVTKTEVKDQTRSDKSKISQSQRSDKVKDQTRSDCIRWKSSSQNLRRRSSHCLTLMLSMQQVCAVEMKFKKKTKKILKMFICWVWGEYLQTLGGEMTTFSDWTVAAENSQIWINLGPLRHGTSSRTNCC